uniref:NADH-ubiquinone oxidoreductase chain 2 n=1 Tax=Psychomyia kalais TaxID=2904897 RepID=A0A9E8RT63_9NEOP|nr:NADH dehydrogenase subunit 2 [Psychomyia kalais]UZZ44338.1 NADH dehydrogenase subunit 2 [Psychomyia kalais]
MFMNSSKMIMLMIMMLSTMFMMSMNSWIMSWMMMEINLFSFIPLIYSKNNLESESMMKYFFIQIICSIMLFMLIIMMWNWMNYKNNIFMLMNMCMLMKLGSAPFHFWYIQIIESMNWFIFFFISTWQKIMPMIMLSYNFNLNLIIFSVYLNSIISMLGSINQTSIVKLLGYSSINQISWMMSSMMTNNNMFNFYMLNYLFMMMNICMMFFLFNIYNLNQMFNLNHSLIIMMMIFFSLGGLPPFMGFLMKWFTINFILYNNFFFMNIFMMMSSLIILYVYLYMLYQLLTFNSFKMKWFIQFKNSKFKMINYNLLMISLFNSMMMSIMYML